MAALTIVEVPLGGHGPQSAVPPSGAFFDREASALCTVHASTVAFDFVDPARGGSPKESFTLTLNGTDPILAAALNPDGTAVAVLHRPTKLAFYTLKNTEGRALSPTLSVVHEIPSRVGSGLISAGKPNAVKGFHWTDPRHLLVVTHGRIDVLELRLPQRQLRAVTGVNATPDRWHYLPATGQLLSLNVQKRTRLRVIRLGGGQTPVETHQIKLDPPTSASCVVRLFPYRGHTLALLCDLGRRELLGWLLGNETLGAARRFLVAPLPPLPDCGVHLLDGLLLLHSPTTQTSLVFDLPLPSQCPAAGPIPLVPIADLPLVAPDGTLPPHWYDPSVVAYHPPGFLLDGRTGHLCEVVISVPDLLAVHPRRHAPLDAAAFCLRRAAGRRPLCEQLVAWMRRGVPLPTLGGTFDLLTAAHAQWRRSRAPPPGPPPADASICDSYVMLPDSPSADGTLSPEAGSMEEGVFTAVPHSDDCLVAPDEPADPPPPARDAPSPSQVSSTAAPSSPSAPTEMVTDDGVLVLDPACVCTEVLLKVRALQCCSPRYFLAAVVEYLRSLEARDIPPDPLLQALVVDLLIQSEPRDYHRLHQFIQFKVIADHVDTARQLLTLEAAYGPSFQLAIDMLSRLGQWKVITDILLERGRMVYAVELLIRYNATGSASEELINRITACPDAQEVFTALHLLQTWQSKAPGEEPSPEVRQTANYLNQLM